MKCPHCMKEIDNHNSFAELYAKMYGRSPLEDFVDSKEFQEAMKANVKITLSELKALSRKTGAEVR